MDDDGEVSDRDFTEAIAGLRTWARVAVWRVVWLHRVVFGLAAGAALLVSSWQLRHLDELVRNLDLSLRGR